ncbi:hypothetical protein R1sor_024135 [Riccia sorocarpa]|uniref:Reverse transcriptase zinc-binding domain-containing protein n=1 Tax=Riccia sorocarpa TaxID=122646 RepID=A0ABD3GRZ8_9MARC
MQKMQFGTTFISFVKALNTNATSFVRINSAQTRSFQISRSVRQDDSHLLLSAERQNLLAAKYIIHSFGLASGLKVQWEKSKARWISSHSVRPDWTQELDWLWATEEDEAGKFLGFHFKDGIDDDAIFQTAFQKVKEKVNNPSYRSTSIHGRVVIANHILYGLIWFLLPLWACGKQKLRKIENLVLRFIWGGTEAAKTRHRVAEKVLHQSKKDGGLGLLSLQAQAQAFVAKTIRWAYSLGTHPLKNWLIHKFDAIADLRWATSHHTWITSPSRGVWPPLSPLMRHICQTWQATSTLLRPLDQLPLRPWRLLSVWGPKTKGVRDNTRSAKIGPFARLKAAGIQDLGDLTADGKVVTPIQEMSNPAALLIPTNLKALERIIDTTPIHSAGYRDASLYMASLNTTPIWCIRLADNAPTEDSQLNHTHAKAAYWILEGKLIPDNRQNLPTDAVWTRVPVATIWTAQNKQLQKFLLTWDDKQALPAALQWRDQTDFLAAPNAAIRKLVSTDTAQVKTRLKSWEASFHIDPSDNSRWRKIWHKSMPVKFAVLQWYIFYRAFPTNTWRHPQLARDQEETWGKCCPNRSAEDIEHLFWRCQQVTEVWRWAAEVLYIAFPETRRWSPTFTHAVLGKDLPDYCKLAAPWWQKWRSIILWTIWTQRNNKIFNDIDPSLQRTKALIWHRMLIQIKDWKAHCRKLAIEDLTLARRAQLDRRAARRLALVTLRIKIQGQLLLGSWRPP